MALTLNHFSIRTDDLDASRRFYRDVLGLTVGPRPDFPFPGHWMYRGDHADIANAVVHLIGIDRAAPKGLDDYLGPRVATALAGSKPRDASAPAGSEAGASTSPASATADAAKTLPGSGAVDHIAFFAEGLAAMVAHLRAQGATFRERTVPSIGLHQLFVTDPSGVVIELNYAAAEKTALG